MSNSLPALSEIVVVALAVLGGLLSISVIVDVLIAAWRAYGAARAELDRLDQ